MKNRFRSSCQGLLAKALLLFGILLAFAGAQAQTTITYFHNDSAGTPWLATDQSGNVVWKENYHPYGTPQKNQPSGEGNRLWFGGKPYDADTGLVYMGARYYMPLLGRFTGMDPKEVNPQQIHSFNRYAYANNNPNKYLDPDGKLAETVWDAFNISLGFQSLVSNVREGNWSGAAVDAAGIAVDGVAAAIPVVPGGAAAGIKLYRTQDKLSDAAAPIAKTEVFANRTAPELKQIYSWGNGDAGIKEAMRSLDSSRIKRIQKNITRSEVESMQRLYLEAAAKGKGGAVAQQRAEYITRILEKWEK